MLKFSLCHLGIRPERSQIYRNSLVVRNSTDIIIKPKKLLKLIQILYLNTIKHIILNVF